jgi:hypothetical protein
MTMNKRGKGTLIAAAAAMLVLSGKVTARATDKAGTDVVHCAGINECKGKGSCDGAGNACKSKNSCKGKGWVEVSSADECVKQGGQVLPPEGK